MPFLSKTPSWILLICLWLGLGMAASAGAVTPRLLPAPQSVGVAEGQLIVTAATPVVARDEAARGAAGRFVDLVRRTTGIALTPSDRASPDAIIFATVPGMGPEAYRIEAGSQGATITASDPSGLFYGDQSVLLRRPRLSRMRRASPGAG